MSCLNYSLYNKALLITYAAAADVYFLRLRLRAMMGFSPKLRCSLLGLCMRGDIR